ncbi:MAG: O-antigen ligase family protein [Candidatus Brocadiaceae bacterium]|nr:O-antigen ligase family protein [Candidatus Brocadiaceae bacterium]
MKNSTDLPKFTRVCNRLIEAFIIFLVAFTPLAFGAREAWAIIVMECVTLLAVTVWLVRMTYEKEITFPKLWLYVPLVIILAIILFQLSPLPPKLIGLISPNTFEIYKVAMPDWPGEAPFESIKTTASGLGISIPTPKNLSTKKPLSIYPFATQNDLLLFLTYLFVFFLVLNNFKEQKALERLSMGIIFTGLFLAAFGLVQHFTWNGKIYWFRETYWLGGQRELGAPFGPFTNRDHFAGYMAMVIPLTLGSLVGRTLRTDLDEGAELRQRLLGFFNREIAVIAFLYSAVCIMILSLLFTLSRGGVISLSVSLIVFVVLLMWPQKSSIHKKKRLIPIFAILGVILLFGIGEELPARFLKNEPLAERWDIWKDSFQIIKDFPVLGTGSGNFPWIYMKYQSLGPENFVDYAHNDYIQLSVEMGLLGLLAFIGGCVIYFICLFSLLRHRKNPNVKAFVYGGIASLAAILVHSLVDFNLHIPSNALLATTIAAINLGFVSTYKEGEKTKSLLHFWKLRLERKWTLVVGYGLAVLLFFFLFSIPVRNGLAGAYFILKEGDTNPTIRLALLQRALSLQPWNSDYSKELANSYILLGERTTALPFLWEAIYLKPTDPFLHLRLAKLLDSFLLLREVPPNYEPWERNLTAHLKASMTFFPIDPESYAESAKLLLTKWNYLDETQRQETLSTVRRTLELDDGTYSEAVLQALWDASGDISIVESVIPKSTRLEKQLYSVIESLKNGNKHK